MTEQPPSHISATFEAAANALQDRCILVTGAGAGIGQAVALACAELGAHVMLLGRSEDNLNQTYDLIESRGNNDCILFPLDLEKAGENNYQEITDYIRQEKGPLHGLIHCAGELGSIGPLHQCSAEQFESVLKVNLTSNFLLTKACIPLLREGRAGTVVFTSSSVGRKARAFWGSYAVSKFGVEALSQIFADELYATEQIRFNSVNPGATNTKMRRKAYPGEDPSNNPMPEAIAKTYVYLMSDESAHLNGQQFDAQIK